MDFMNLLHYLQILKMFYLSLYFLGNSRKIFMTRHSFEDFEYIVAIWLLKYFNLWAFDVVSSLCHDISDYPVCVMTPSMWRPVCVMAPSVWHWVRFLDLKWYWIFYGSQWIICSFIVTLRSLVLQYVYHSCHDVKEIYFGDSQILPCL